MTLTNGAPNWYDSYVNYAVTNGIIEKDYANYTKAQMNAPVTRGEFVHIFHGAEEAYKAINTVADNAIPDVKATDKFAAAARLRPSCSECSKPLQEFLLIFPKQ